MTEENAQPALYIQLDPLGGAAGDMFIAAVLHAFPDLRPGMLESIRQAGLPASVGLAVATHADHALTGLRFVVDESSAPSHAIRHAHGHEHEHEHEHGHGHEHGDKHPRDHAHAHRAFRDIRAQLQAAVIDEDVRRHAIAIFTLLAQAEAQVHGKTVEDVSFHELGEWDSIADIVGAAFLIAALPAQWFVGPLPLGSGRVNTAHGPLPVPAPATALLLQGFDCIDDGVGGERVTPTGAAILRYLGANQPRRGVGGRLRATGLGFGTRQLPGLSNVLRLLAFEAGAPLHRDRVCEIVFEVDDQTPEDLALGLDRLREQAGVRDVLQMAALGKKGRMTVQVRVLADPDQQDAVCAACLDQTTTIGLRLHTLERRVLPRRELVVDSAGQAIRVKAVQRGMETTYKAEADDIGQVGGSRHARDCQRQRAESGARAIEPRQERDES